MPAILNGISPAVSSRLKKRLQSAQPFWLVFMAMLSIAVALQWVAGAFRSEFWGFDEAAHFVTGVMVHDYIASIARVAPMKFAQDFYAHYPKVALGHWPPVFYIVQALWTLLFSVSRASLLLLQAVIAALIAVTLWSIWRRHWGELTAFVAGASFLLLPAVQDQTNTVMAEALLTLWMLLAVVNYESYLKRGDWRSAILFSCFTIAAVLTKANGWCLMLVPAVAMVLARRFDLLRRGSFWFPAAAVAFVCLPWYLLTFKMASNGWRAAKQSRFFESVIAFNARAQVAVLGWVLLGLALAGILLYVLRPARQKAVTPRWAAFAAWWAAVFLFHTFLAPVREIRHQTLAAPAALSFAWAAVAWARTRFRAHAWFQPVILASAVALFFLTTFHVAYKPVYGAKYVVAMLTPQLRSNQTVLVSSSWAGEGAIVAETVLQERHSAPVILRASKLFTESDWGGWNRKLTVTTPEEALAVLRRNRVSVVIVDLHSGEQAGEAPQQRLLLRTIQTYPNCFQALGLTDAAEKFFRAYSFRT
ncbi:MAG TPA: glycosyltransferase family 39 protein [Bryobacteraceae bacterium]|jgi:hypothetical protein|nr:glycosyltransferase family 39 protein [Bryobacteraceae bacterium]